MMLEKWIALPAGILISTVVSSIGLGGGILWMPIFLILFKMKPDTAVITSLLIQTAGMGSGSLAFSRQKRVDYNLACVLLLLAAPGIFIGAYSAYFLTSSHMKMILGILVMVTALLFVSSNSKYEDLGKMRVKILPAFQYSWPTIFLSMVSGLLSVSMGEWLVPIMRTKLSLKMSSAIASSIFITFGTCVIGAMVHLIMGGTPDLSILLWAIPGVIVGGQIGPRITEKINERLLKEIFIFLLTLLGIHLIYNSY